VVVDEMKAYANRLRRLFPQGVPEAEYFALLAVLAEDFSERQLAGVMAEVMDDELVVMSHDIARAQSTHRPPFMVREAMKARLAASGWEFDDEWE
jgi:hypothetical protein